MEAVEKDFQDLVTSEEEPTTAVTTDVEDEIIQQILTSEDEIETTEVEESEELEEGILDEDDVEALGHFMRIVAEDQTNLTMTRMMMMQTGIETASISDASIDKIHLCNVDSPFLLMGQAAIGSQDFGIELILRFSGGATASISEQGLSLYGSPPKEGTDVFMTCRQSNQTTGIANTRTNDIEIGMETWRAIEALAAKTYVTSSEISRAKGAGAGLIDNC